MKKFIIKTILQLRKILEPITWLLFHPRNLDKLENLDEWRAVKSLEPKIFSQRINRQEYKSDPLKGLLDFSHPLNKPEYFFKKLPYGRDCDNWSRIWMSYYQHHNRQVSEWLVTNKHNPFTKNHFVAIVKEDDGYHLLNYKRYERAWKNEEDALNDLERWNNGTYNKENRIACKYKEIFKK